MGRRGRAARVGTAILAFVTVSCAGERAGSAGADVAAAVRAHVAALAADGMDGRRTGTPGHARAAEYVAERFAEIGLDPMDEDGSFRRPVALAVARSLPDETTIALRTAERALELEVERDYVLEPDFLRQSAELTAPLIFAGAGVEHADWSGLDVDGRVVVVPTGAADARAAVQRAAVERGAVGVLFADPAAAADAWERNVTLSRLPAMRRLQDNGAAIDTHSELFVVGDLSPRGCRRLLELLERDAFEAGDFGVELFARTASAHDTARSANVVARLPGRDPARRAEHVVLLAHLDHLGSIPVEAGGDGIFNGAYDGAAGVATMLEVAWALAVKGALERSVIFLAATGGEQGALGADRFAALPPVPAESIVVVVALDLVPPLRPIESVSVAGDEAPPLRRAVDRALVASDLRRADAAERPHPALTTSSAAPFERRGVPALRTIAGDRATLEPWLRETYRTPRDDADQPFDESAADRFVRFTAALVENLAGSP